MRMNERMKKLISALLCLCMLVQNAPVVAFAAQEDCTHHAEHTEQCGYMAAVEGQPCTHSHDTAVCGYAEAVEEVLCACTQTDENGAPVHTEGCGYIAPVASSDCTHVHDDACGYVAAVEAHECHYECAECAAEETEPSEATEPSGQPVPQDLVPVEHSSVVSVTVAPDADLPDNDELFAMYAEQQFYGYEMATFGTRARQSLNDIEKAIYDALKPKIETVASSGGSAVFALSGITGLKTEWTNTELDVDSIEDTSAVKTEFDAQFSLDSIVSALLSDCPFDLYWYDKTTKVGVEMGYNIDLRGYNDGTQDIWEKAVVSNLTITFAVATGYANGENTVTTDVEKISGVKTAAQAVVDANKDKSNYEKLVAYKEYICNAVSYDTDAADETKNTPYGDPWQLIYVFDGDENTNVVCEGYSKAFQYLCDLDDLSNQDDQDDFYCISVTGNMTGGTGAGGHMWNIVTLDDENYLVDVTNSDDGSVGQDGGLFLVGNATGSVADGYSFAIGDQTITYIYEKDTKDLFNGSELTLAAEDYTVPGADGWYKVEGNTLTIDGTLGGKTMATDDDVNALLEAIKGYVDSGITTLIVTGSNPALYNVYDVDTPAVSAAIFLLTESDEGSSYYGTIDLILPNVTEIVQDEFAEAYALNSITLPKVTKLGGRAFSVAEYLQTITFGSVLTEVDESTGAVFYRGGEKVGGCDLVLICGQINENSVEAPNLDENSWLSNNFKSITLTHTGGTATCTEQAVCDLCGEGYGEVDLGKHYDGCSHYYSITFCSDQELFEDLTIEVLPGDTVTADMAPETEYAHYEFTEWYDSDTLETITFPMEMPERNLEICAIHGKKVYEAKLILTPNENVKFNYYYADHLDVIWDELKTIYGDHSWEGHSLTGWEVKNGNNGYIYQLEMEKVRTDSLIITAQWKCESLTHVEAKAGTCSAEGNIEYYECTCGKLYADAEAATLLTGEVTTPKDSTNHTWNDGTCTGCGAECAHETCTDGICDGCGYVCPHDYFWKGKCETCGIEALTINNVFVQPAVSKTLTGVCAAEVEEPDEFAAKTTQISEGPQVMIDYNILLGKLEWSAIIGVTVTDDNNPDGSGYTGSNIMWVNDAADWYGKAYSLYDTTDGQEISAYYPYSEDGILHYDLAQWNYQPLYGAMDVTGTSVDLTLERKMAKLAVNIAGLPDDQSVTAVELNGIYLTATFDGATGALSPTGEPGAIGMQKNGNSWTTMLIPMNEGDVTLRVKLQSGKVYAATFQLAPEAGTAYNLTVNLGHGKIKTTPNDGVTHTLTCEFCNETIGNGNHTGGTATCIAQAVCGTCGVSYGEVDPTNHVESTYDDNGFRPCCGKDYQEPALENGVYQIANAGQLYWFADKVNQDNTNFGSANAILVADIVVNKNLLNADGTLGGDASDLLSWIPIGNNNNKYTGTFDGNDHTISGLYCNEQNLSYVGLFGFLSSDAVVKNVSLTDSYIRGDRYVGGLAGQNSGKIANCSNAGTVSGADTNSQGAYVGGLAGYNNGKITASGNTGVVSTTGAYAGGLVGRHYGGELTNSFNTGSVSGTTFVGGLCGYAESTYSVTNCYNTGSVSGTDSRVGGLVGHTAQTEKVTNSYYLTGCAKDGNGTPQNGIGNVTAGSTTEDTADTVAKSETAFASGEVAYLLQGEQSEPVWGQTCGQGLPALGGPKVYFTYVFCKGDEKDYTNDEESSGTRPSHTGGTATCTAQASCSVCGESYGELNFTNHVASTYDDNGFQTCCGQGYQPAPNVDGVYQISNAGQLYWFAALVNRGNLRVSAVLTKDITVNANVLKADGTLNGNGTNFRPWIPIGANSMNYLGHFEGNNHTVSGLYVNGEAKEVGFFARVTDNATVKNLGIIDSYFKGYSEVGGLVGFLGKASVTNCYSKSTVIGTRELGGLCGYASSGTVTNCYNTGSIGSDTSSYVGGVIGYLVGCTVTNCYNTGSISSKYSAGGVAGIFDGGNVTDCYSTGSVSGNSYVGGLVGEKKNGTTQNCYYLSDSAAGDETAKTTAAFASGEVAYLLQGEQSEPVWGQEIGKDAAPTLGGQKVYFGYDSCAADVRMVYTNNSEVFEEKPGHSFGDYTTTADSHSRTCSVCDAKEFGEHSFDSTTGKCTVCDMNCIHRFDDAGKCTICQIAAKVKVDCYNDTSAFEMCETFYYASIAAAMEAAATWVAPHGAFVYPLTPDNSDFVITGSYTLFYGEEHTFAGDITVQDGASIVSGVYTGTVTVTNNAYIDEGTFEGDVINNGGIAGGTFNGAVTNNGSIIIMNPVILNGTLTNNEGGSVEDHGRITVGENFRYVAKGGTVDKNHVSITGATCQNKAVCTFCGESFGDFAQHEISYIADDDADTITCRCDNCDTQTVVFTLKIPTGAVYGGGRSFPSAERSGYEGYNGYPAIRANGATEASFGFGAGTYTVTMELGGQTVTGNRDFVIAKANPTYTVPTGLTAVYGETLADVNNLPADFAWTDPAQSVGNVGTNTFTATYDLKDSNYNVIENIAVQVQVAPKEVTSADITVTGSYTYTGSEQTVVLNGFESGYMTIASGNKGTNAGAYEVVITLDSNHKWTDGSNGKIQWTIAKAKAAITVDTTPITVTYGEAVTLPSATSNFGTVTKTHEDLKNVGTYTVTYSVAGTDNYDGDSKTVTVTINAKPITAADVALKGSLSYTGEELTQNITAAEGITYEVTGNKATNVGSYQLTVTGTGNYTGEVKLTWTIKESAAKLTKNPVAETLTYNGTERALVTAGATADGKLVYSLSENGTYAETIPTGKDAGQYTVWYYVQGDENHADSAKASVEVTIAKAQVTVTVAAKDKAYDGTTTATLEASVNGVVQGDVLAVEGITGQFSDANAGENKTVSINASQASLTGDDAANYTITQVNASTTATITKTAAAAPAAGVGYSLDYFRELITVAVDYEVVDEQNKAVTSGSVENYLGKTLKVRLKETTNQEASAWTSFAVAERPAQPNVSVKNETLKGQRDGAVSGITAAMEYSTDNGNTWTSLQNASAVSNLQANTTILVRVKATENAPHGAVKTCTISEGAAITVSYVSTTQEANGMPEEITGQSYGTKLVKPADPTAKNTDFAFRGWYKDAACTNAWDFVEDTLTAETVTLYAKWEQVYFSVTAVIQDHNGNEYHDDVQVQLMRGDTMVDSVTGTSGRFAFSRHVEAGMYNLVAVYTDDSGEHTKTELITVDHDDTYILKLPAPGVNSHLTVSNNAQTPDVMVGGLDAEAETVKQQAGDQATVEVEMTVSGKTESQVSQSVVSAVESATDDATVEYLDITVTKQVNGGEKTEMTETANILEIVVPYNGEGKANLRVFRYHNGVLQKFVNNRSRADCTFFYADGHIRIFTNHFSDYMIAYDVKYTVTLDANGGTLTPESIETETNGTLNSLPTPIRTGYVFQGWYTAKTGGTKVTTDTVFSADATIYAQWSGYPVTVTGTTNGTVTVDKSNSVAGELVTITVKPKSGYKLSTLTVKDANGKTYVLGTDNNGKYSFTMPAANVTVTATFTKTSTATADPTNPKTGDDFQIVFWNSMMMTTMLGVAALLLNKKKFLEK